MTQQLVTAHSNFVCQETSGVRNWNPKMQPSQGSTCASFGGGTISPSVRTHLTSQLAKSSHPATRAHDAQRQPSFGGGNISPAVRAHLTRSASQTSEVDCRVTATPVASGAATTPRISIGESQISPELARHFARSARTEK
jgi:hypothetical protein